MTHRLPLPALLACAALASSAVAAQTPNIKPGLWELNNRVSSPDPQIQSAMSEMQKQLANMSPEQRQSLQQLMDRNGVQFQLGAGGTLQSRVCMTREMIERKQFPVQDGTCTQNVTPLSATRMQVGFTCTKPRASGQGELVMESETRYRGRVTIRSEERSGTVDMEVDGKWLGADCGAVRPVGVSKAK